MKTRLILASSSAARADLLRGAGLDFEVIPAEIDESSMQKSLPGPQAAAALARAKAEAVSTLHPLATVIGADQVLVLDGKTFSKAGSLREAQEHLRALQGRTHTLVSAVCVAHAGKTVWEESEQASLTMKNFDDAFTSSYLDVAGDDVLRSVGCYALEGPGIWLFDRIEGDYFTILGLPLLKLLKFLEKQGVMPWAP